MKKRISSKDLTQFSCTFGIVALMIGTINTDSQESVTVAKQVLPSTVLLVMEDSNGQPVSLGSGFFVRKNEIATNLHVVDESESGYIIREGQTKKINIEGMVATDVEHDLVILKVQETNAPTLSLGDSEAVQVGESVYAVGNPNGLSGTFSEGIVSAVRKFEGETLLQITAPISRGSSGGPIVNSEGLVIGVSVAIFDKGQNLNFAIPSKYLTALLQEETDESLKPLSELNEIKSNESVYKNINTDGSDEVVGVHFAWKGITLGNYTFSIHNQLRSSVSDVRCLVIFYAKDGIPIETEYVNIPGPIPGKLSKRTPELGRLDGDEVRVLTSKTEIRVLDFRLDD